MSTRTKSKTKEFDRKGFIQRITTPEIRSRARLAGKGYGLAADDEIDGVNLPVACHNPEVVSNLMRSFGGEEPTVDDKGDVFTVSNGVLLLSCARDYPMCFVCGARMGDFE